MFFFDTCNAVAAREDMENQNIDDLGVTTSQRQIQGASDCVMLLESIT